MPSNIQDITKRYVDSYYKLYGERKVKNKKEFAQKTGLAPNNLPVIEKGERNATINNLYLLSKTFEISLDWLFFGEGEFYKNESDKVS